MQSQELWQTKNSLEVNKMFSEIAPNYQLANTVLSLGIDKYWRKSLLKMIPVDPNGEYLDLCTGTGDLLPGLRAKCKKLVGVDFCLPMLKLADPKYAVLIQADALNLPFDNDSFDLVTVAFGVRNFEDLNKGLSEIYRILKTNGQLFILEFASPQGILAVPYKFYSNYALPFLGGLITKKPAAYRYLEQTSKTFPSGLEFEKHLKLARFANVKTTKVTFGVVNIYFCMKL